jgi:hypothetical protein
MPNRNRTNRKNKSRKNRRCWSRRNRSQYGGATVHSGAPVNDTSMALGQKDNLSQGQQFQNIHRTQHGGAAAYPSGVTDSVLTGPMVAAARTGPLDVAIAQTRGMQDGGRRRRLRKGKKSRGQSRRRRVHRGGAYGGATGSPLTANPMLLPSGLEKSAQLNSDWDAARNPNYWAPKQ